MRFFIDNIALTLTPEVKESKPKTNVLYLEAKEVRDVWDIYNTIKEEETQSFVEVCAEVPDYEQVTKRLKQKFKFLQAAGGLIFQNKKVLFIYRRGKWDLPKGKIDLGESPRQAALREVWEECQVKAKIIRPLIETWHTYSTKKAEVLKQTFWYEMQALDASMQRPQTEEDIEQIAWISLKKTSSIFQNTYPSIVEVTQAFLQK